MNKHLGVLFINIDLILRVTELTIEIHRFEQIYQMVSVSKWHYKLAIYCACGASTIFQCSNF